MFDVRNLIAEKLNEAATFQPGDRAARPALVIGGIRVLAWVDNEGFFRIQAETDGGFTDPGIRTYKDGTIAMSVAVDDTVIFTRRAPEES